VQKKLEEERTKTSAISKNQRKEVELTVLERKQQSPSRSEPTRGKPKRGEEERIALSEVK